MEPFLDADALRAHTFVRHVELHDTLGSTNDRAAELAGDATLELPALIAARHQTAGRGRGSNIWRSADGALTFSLLLEPAALGIGTAEWPQLSMATAVAVCMALEKVAPKAIIRIKWPNDVILNGGKVCGILLESPGGAVPKKNRLIIGIGINVNNEVPPAGDRNHRDIENEVRVGIALCAVTGSAHDLQSLLALILRSISSRFGELASHDPQLPSAWQRRDWLIEQSVEAYANGRRLEGICLGIDVDGSLMIENAFGTHRIHSGTVRVKQVRE